MGRRMPAARAHQGARPCGRRTSDNAAPHATALSQPKWIGYPSPPSSVMVS
jgi:hypothetical protein